MDKPDDSVAHLYEKYDCNGVFIWVNNNVDKDNINELKIGYKKYLFFGELTVSGISSQVFVQ